MPTPSLSASWHRPWTPGDGNRVSFNGGWHDGADDVRKGREVRDVSGHPTPAYAVGYVRGVAAAKAGEATSDSTRGWDAAVAAGETSAGEPEYRAGEMTKLPTFRKMVAAFGVAVCS